MNIENFDTQWALINGYDIFIKDAQGGRKGYKCIGCNRPLEAVKKKKKPKHKSFFRHFNLDKDFHCDFNSKEYLERKIEQMIIELGFLNLPKLHKYPPLENDGSSPILLKDKQILKPHSIKAQISFFLNEYGELMSGAKTGVTDKKFHIRPDLTFFNEDGKPILFVEIVITNAIDDEKKAKLIEIGIDTIQIEITPAPSEELKQIIQSGSTIKWVYNNEEFHTKYIFVPRENEKELPEFDPEQKKLFTESFACRKSRIGNFIHQIRTILGTKQYGYLKDNLESEIERVEELRKAAATKLGKMEKVEKDRVYSEFTEEEKELGRFEKEERERSEQIKEDHSDLEERYFAKTEQLSEQEIPIRSREREEFGAESPIESLPRRRKALSNDIERLKNKRKNGESDNNKFSEEERRIDVQLAEFDRIETRLGL